MKSLSARFRVYSVTQSVSNGTEALGVEVDLHGQKRPDLKDGEIVFTGELKAELMGIGCADVLLVGRSYRVTITPEDA